MKKRNVALAITGGIMALSLALVPATIQETSAQTTSYFKMVDGASVRTVAENTGIRFMATMSEDVYTQVNNNANKSFGMIIVPEEYLDGCTDGKYVEYLTENYITTDEETGEVVNQSGVIYDLDAYTFKEQTCISGAITNLQYKNLNRDFVGIAFIKTVDGETATYEYAQAQGETYDVRNVVYVSSVAYTNPEDYAKAGEVLKGFVENGVKQSAGLAETADMPEISVELDKTSVSYFENTPVNAVYKVNGNVLDIDLCSSYEKVSGNASLKNGNVISATSLNISPNNFAEYFSNGFTLSVSVPALNLVEETNVAISCDYDALASLEKTVVNVQESFDMASYLAGKVSLKDGHSFDKFIYYNNGKVHTINQTNGVFDVNESMEMTAVKESETLEIVDAVKGQNERTLVAYVQGANGNTLQLVNIPVVFFELNTVLERGVFKIDETYLETVKSSSSGGALLNSPATISTSLTYTNGNGKEATVTDTLMHFVSAYSGGGVHLSFPSDYEVSVLEYVRSKGYTLAINKWQNDNTSNVGSYWRTGTAGGDLSNSATARAHFNMQNKWYNSNAIDWDGYLTSLKATTNKEKAMVYFQTVGTGNYYFSNIYFVAPTTTA